MVAPPDFDKTLLAPKAKKAAPAPAKPRPEKSTANESPARVSEPEKKTYAAGKIPISKLSMKINPGKEKARENKQESEENAKTAPPAEDFSFQRFLEIWNQFAESKKEENQTLFLAMTKQKPVLTKDEMIEVSLDNAIQEDMINECRSELLSFLRQKLSNYSINLSTRIKKASHQKKAYLPKDKLKKLTEKNPGLKRLKDDLDLDFVY